MIRGIKMENNYKEKLGEIANEAQNVVSSIATEENKQKVAEAAETTVKKVKSLNKKTLIIIAVAVVAVIAIFSLFGGNEHEKVVEDYISEYYEDKVKSIKEVWSDKYEVDLGYGNWVDAEATLFQVKGKEYYYIFLVTSAGDYVDIEESAYSKKSDMKSELKIAKKSAKDGVKSGKKEGVIR